MPRNLKDIARFKHLKLHLKVEDILNTSLLELETEPLINYSFKDGKAIDESGKFEAIIKDCIFNQSIDGKNDVFEFNKAGSHIKIPAKDMILSGSAVSISMDMKFQDNNQERINLFEGSSIPLVLMLLRKNGKYYLASSVNLSNGWQVTTAENDPINPNQWFNLSTVFTGEEIFIFKDNKCIARRIFKDAKLKDVEAGESFIGTWVDGRRDQFKGMISSFKLWDNIAGHLNSEMDRAVETGMGEIESKYIELGGDRGFLGQRVGTEKDKITKVVDGRNKVVGRYIDFKNGTIYWSNSTGAHEVHGAILVRYKALNGPLGKLGFPRTDEINGSISGSKVSRFENGAIYWSGGTGAYEITNHLYAKYITLGGEGGFLGLPTTGEVKFDNGYSVILQRGRLFFSEETGAHEVHGAILDKYVSVAEGTRKGLGLPTSDELDILDKNGKPTGKKVSNFQSGSIYWSSSTGAHEVHGSILKRYIELGGPSGIMGLPISDESTAPNSGYRYNDFEKGIILWRGGWLLAREFTNLQLRLGKVVSSSIDDGYNFLSKDRSAELVTYTTVKINNTVADNGTRRPGGHAGTSHDINMTYPISNIKHNTKIYFKVKVDDWDQASGNDYLGTIEKTFDISTLWGVDNGSNGIYHEHPLTDKGGDSPNHNSVRLSFAIAIPSVIDPNKSFREQFWWKFDNFKGPKPLSRDFYANTFKDVDIIGDNLWEKILNPLDTAIYELAYKNIAANGNCFGMSLEALDAIKNNSLFTIPLNRYEANNNSTYLTNYNELPPYIYSAINRKHGYQIGSSAVGWALKKLLSGNATSPAVTDSNVRTLIDRGDYPIISMMSISKGSGHAVLAYKYTTTQFTTKIFVADPNYPYPRDTINGDAGYIEIDRRTNSFKFYTGDKNNDGSLKVSYQTGTVLSGFLDDTYMMEIPYSVVSSHPTTPFLYVLLGLVAVLGGLIFLLGDAESEQISSDNSNFYDYPNGQKRQTKGGVKGLARIPIFDGPENSLEIYALQGEPPKSLEFTVKGNKNGTYAQHFGTYNNMLKIEAPIRSNEKDYIHIEETNTSRPNISIKTSGAPKDIKLSYETLKDNKKKDNTLYNINLQVTKDESIVGIDPLGGSLIISQAGLPKEILIEKEFWINNTKTKQVLKINPSRENEIIKIRDFDIDKVKNQVVIERINLDTGKLINRTKDKFR